MCQADTFSLSAILANDRLTIRLKDFVSWVIYSKQYTEEDIGKEIHQKMDLTDICASFSYPQAEHRDNQNQLSHYEFGSVVECRGTPCYKIETGGKVSSYLVIIDKKCNKEIVYESRLQLAKVRNLTELQIYVQMLPEDKKKTYDQLTRDIEQQEREKQILLNKIASIEADNSKLEEEIRRTKLKFDSRSREQEEKAIQAIKAAIDATCIINGEDLLYKVCEILRQADIRYEDIARLSIPEAEANKLKYPIKVYIPKPADSATSQQIKQAFIGALFYPLQLTYPEADTTYVQHYSNVPFQQILSAQLGHPQSIQKLKVILFFCCWQICQSHQYHKILDQYQKSIRNLQYEIFYLFRADTEVKVCFRGSKWLRELDQNFFSQLCEIKEEFGPILKKQMEYTKQQSQQI